MQSASLLAIVVCSIYCCVGASFVYEPLCPRVPSKCDDTAPWGQQNSCPAWRQSGEPGCVGGCCSTMGKCSRGLCGLVGLGVEVMRPDMLCWGTNNGSVNSNRLNKCSNLACELSVPGCVGDFISGACVGSVVAIGNGVDPAAARWIGYPCLQPLPAGLPTDYRGKVAAGGMGRYAAKLWSICNCRAPVPKLLLTECAGPLCDLLRRINRPKKPLLDMALPSFGLSNLGKLLGPKAVDMHALGALFEAAEKKLAPWQRGQQGAHQGLPPLQLPDFAALLRPRLQQQAQSAVPAAAS